jgi:hypothetical protein
MTTTLEAAPPTIELTRTGGQTIGSPVQSRSRARQVAVLGAALLRRPSAR